MGVRTLTDWEEGRSVLYDSVTDTAFGPVFDGDEANEFCDWNTAQGRPDLRSLTPEEFTDTLRAWRDSKAVDQLCDDLLS